MKKIAIVTDSSATLPEALVQELGIYVVPNFLNFEGQTFRDGIDIAPGEVYRWLRSGKDIPTTAAPSMGDFLRVYAAAGREASGVVSIHMSPDLSANYNTATMTGRLMDGMPVRVVDCHTAAMGQGFVVLEAARAAASGASLEEVVARALQVAAKVDVVFIIGTLEYLHRGGRIGGAAMLLGKMLQIKPVLYLADGVVDVFARSRSKARATRILLQRVADRAGGRPIHAAIFHADALEEAEALQQKVAEQFDCVELYMTEFTPVIGAHTGPGVVGVAFYADCKGGV